MDMIQGNKKVLVSNILIGAALSLKKGDVADKKVGFDLK